MKIYTKPNCEKCDDIKKKLKEKGVAFEEKGMQEPGVLQEIRVLLKDKPNAIMPILQFDDGSVVSNDMGLYKELKARSIL